MNRRALLAAAAAAAALAPCLPGLLSGGLSIPGDGAEIPLPALAAAGQALAAGQAPVWTELLYAGAPLAASGGAGVLYPPNALLFAALPAGLAYTVALALHLLLAAWGSAAFARRLGASDLGQAVAAVAFACGGFTVGHAENLLRVEAIAFAPWAFLCAEALARTPGPRAAARWGLVIGAAALTGYYPFTVYLSGWALVYAVLRTLQEQPDARSRAAAAGLAIAGTIGGVLVSMVQTLPTAVATLRSARVADRDPTLAVDNSLHPQQLLELLAPFSSDPVIWDAQMVFYLGLLPLALALVAWSPRSRGARRQPAAALAAVAVASTLLSLGEHLPGYGALTVLVPPLAELGRPYRLFIGGSVAIAALAGLGVSAPGRARAVALSGIAGLGALLALRVELPGAWRLTAAGAAAALVAAGASAVASERGRRWLTTAAGALLFAELALLQATLLSDAALPPQRLETPETAAWLKDHLAPGERFLSLRPADDEDPALLWMQAPMRFGLASVNSPVSDLIPRWFVEAYADGREGPVSPAVLGLLRVRYVLSRGPRRGGSAVAEVAGLTVSELVAAPRAFAVGEARVLPRADLLAGLATLEAPWEAALFEEPPPPIDGAGDCGAVAVEAASPTTLTLRYQGDRACYVVITDAWDPDWRAQIDGADVPLLRAYGGLKAVAVPAGERLIALTYRPWALRWGLGLSLVSLLALAALARRPLPGAAEPPDRSAPAS